MELNDQQLERYARHIILKEIGGTGQKRLLGSKVLVVGAGGLGTPLILYLAAAGVGTIAIVDDDVVALSNLQRQIAYTGKDVGRAKTAAASDRLEALNDDIKIVPINHKLDAKNAAAMLEGYDLAADCTDNFATRFALADACRLKEIPLVSAALSQFDGQLSTYTPYALDDQGARLPCYRCLVSDDPGPGAGETCADQGILGAIAGVMGSLQAVEVIKVLLGLGDTLAGYLLVYDGLGTRFRRIRLRQDPACPSCSGTTSDTSLSQRKMSL